MADPAANQVTVQAIRERYPQYGDMSDEALVNALHQKYYSDMPLADFQAKVGYKAAPPAAPQPTASWTNPADLAIGSGEALGTGVVNLIPNAVNAVADIVHPGSKPMGTMSPGQTATDLGHSAAASPIGQWVSQKLQDLQTRFNSAGHGGDATFGGDLGRNELRVTNDLMNALPVVGGLKNIVTGGVKNAAESAIVPPTPSESFKAGYRSAADHPIAAGAAGQSGIDALTLHNQQIGNVRLGNTAGVAPGDQLTHQSLQKGAEAPNSVFNRVANALPEMPLSPENTAAVNNIGVNDLVTHTPDAQAILAANKARLTSGPLTGDQAIDNLRALRQEGFARLGGPAADVEQQNLGKAQLKMADVLEGHIGDNLPENGDVSLDQFKDARTALAQNHAVAGALHGNNVDLGAIARMQNASPNLLTGELRLAGDFANAHPAVSGLANHIEVPPSMANDVGEALNSARSHDVIGRMLQATGVASKARKILTGDTAATVAAAQAELQPYNASRFAPLEPKAPEPGNWSLGTGAGTPSPQAPLGDFASVLSHGVEQPGATGLSSGPMGSPNSGGLPFQAPPESVGAQVVHGGAPPLKRVVDDYGNLHWLDGNEPDSIQLGNRFATNPTPADRPASVLADRPTVNQPQTAHEPTLADLMEQLNDYAGVKSQGVPEGIAAKAGPSAKASKPWLVDADRPNANEGLHNLLDDIFGHDDEGLSNNASGQTDVSQEFANWQASRKAAGVNRFRYDPESDSNVPLHSADARDPPSVKGRPVFDQDAKGNFTVIDRGGLNQTQLNGIINRMTKLGDAVQ